MNNEFTRRREPCNFETDACIAFLVFQNLDLIKARVPNFTFLKSQIDEGTKKLTNQNLASSGKMNTHPFSELVMPSSIMQDDSTATYK